MGAGEIGVAGGEGRGVGGVGARFEFQVSRSRVFVVVDKIFRRLPGHVYTYMIDVDSNQKAVFSRHRLHLSSGLLAPLQWCWGF